MAPKGSSPDAELGGENNSRRGSNRRLQMARERSRAIVLRPAVQKWPLEAAKVEIVARGSMILPMAPAGPALLKKAPRHHQKKVLAGLFCFIFFAIFPRTTLRGGYRGRGLNVDFFSRVLWWELRRVTKTISRRDDFRRIRRQSRGQQQP